jgi:hypothetical protein
MNHILIPGIGLQLCSAFCGINTVILYSASIFSYAGINNAVLAAALVGGKTFLGMIHSLFALLLSLHRCECLLNYSGATYR